MYIQDKIGLWKAGKEQIWEIYSQQGGWCVEYTPRNLTRQRETNYEFTCKPSSHQRRTRCMRWLIRTKSSTVTSINWIIKRRNSKEKGKKDKVMPFKETGKEVLWWFSAQDDTGRWRIRQGNICHPLWPCKSPAENPDSQGRVSEDKNTSYHVGVRSPIPGHHAKWLIHTISSNSRPALQRIIISPYGPGNGFREQLEFS